MNEIRSAQDGRLHLNGRALAAVFRHAAGAAHTASSVLLAPQRTVDGVQRGIPVLVFTLVFQLAVIALAALIRPGFLVAGVEARLARRQLSGEARAMLLTRVVRLRVRMLVTQTVVQSVAGVPGVSLICLASGYLLDRSANVPSRVGGTLIAGGVVGMAAAGSHLNASVLALLVIAALALLHLASEQQYVKSAVGLACLTSAVPAATESVRVVVSSWLGFDTGPFTLQGLNTLTNTNFALDRLEVGGLWRSALVGLGLSLIWRRNRRWVIGAVMLGYVLSRVAL